MNLKNNSDDVFIRSALVAMIADLNNMVKIDYINNTTQETETYTVPFFIDLGIGSNDRFYRDFYYKNEYCDCVILNNYDKTPRIHVTPGGITLKTDEVTSPFGQADYTQTIEGRETWTTSFIHMLPISIELEFTAKSDSFTEVLKIWQSIIDYSIYNTIPSNFVYKNLNCDSTIIIEVPTVEKTFTFSAEDPTDELLGFKFSGRLDTYYPAIRNKYYGYIEKIKSNVDDTNNNELSKVEVPDN